MVKIETVNDAATCSVIVVDHVVNLLEEMGKCVKKYRVRGEESKLCSFFFFFLEAIQWSQSCFVC